MSTTIYLAIGEVSYSPFKVLHAYTTREAAEERIRAGEEWIEKWSLTKPSQQTVMSPEWIAWFHARSDDAPNGEDYASFDILEVEMD